MKIGFYPGTFNPWHRGHQDVLDKALKLFDKIIIYQLTNPEKSEVVKPIVLPNMQSGIEIYQKPNTFLFIVIGNYVLGHAREDHQYAVIRGLRNAADLDYEKVQQYYNTKAFGMKIPTVYFVADEEFVNISSTAERMIEKFQALEEKRREEERRSYEENS